MRNILFSQLRQSLFPKEGGRGAVAGGAIVGFWLLVGVAGLGAAESGRGGKTVSEVDDLSLEQLIHIRVTSVSKKETPLHQSPAAISVITPEDIRRAGLTSIPEALRLAPGLNVARINASEWAISARGFNDNYANKLQVLVDGRSVYTPVFAGAVWNVQDLVLEDLDRIEVMRGPGAALWGANAVNGVINIITKSAQETQGWLVTTTVGTLEQPFTSLRYGGELAPNLFYRVYGKYGKHNGLKGVTGDEISGEWEAWRGGFRLDWHPSENDQITWQGDFYDGEFEQSAQSPSLLPPYFTVFNGENRNQGNNAIVRWTHDFSDRSQLKLQFYYDRLVHHDIGARAALQTYDFDLQHRWALGERQDIVWGVGYRYFPYKIESSDFIAWLPETRRGQLVSAFGQNDITLVEDRLRLTLGVKLEEHDYTGLELEPSGRLLWTPSEKQTVWGAISRSVRIPSQFERGSRLNLGVSPPSADSGGLPTALVLFGNAGFQSEEVMSYDLGYRLEATPQISFDLALFYNDYARLQSWDPGGAPYLETEPTPHWVSPLRLGNSLEGRSYGGELSVQWRVTEDWKLQASYACLHLQTQPSSGVERDAPQNQFQLHSHLNLPHHWEFNSSLYYVDAVPGYRIPSYFRWDVGLNWRPHPSWELGVWGQNLLDGQHAEFGTIRTPVRAEIPRSVYAKITCRF